MFRQGQLAVHGLAILLGRNEAGISNRGKIFLHHAVVSPLSLHLRPLNLFSLSASDRAVACD